jgi:histidinol dehydrogenase
MIGIETFLAELEERRRTTDREALRFADEAIEAVRTRGDACVHELSLRYPSPDRGRRQSEGLAKAIEIAIQRIESFHRQQMPAPYRWTRRDTTIEHRVLPLKRIGIYVPGGRAIYISTLIMCAVPARIAGVKEIVVATPAADDSDLRYVCEKLGVAQIYRAGGAAAIAALAIGTETLRRVDKIVGPGNAWVTAAKSRLFGTVGIDMTAGPTELIAIADETADPLLVAADLMAQAEHGTESAVICLCTAESTARAIREEWRPSPERGPLHVFTGSVGEAIDVVNRVAPEHLSIHARDAEAIAARVENCGAIFCGPWSAPAAGDYALGANHVLPTAGSARFFSPLGVYDFVKRSNVITAGRRDVESIAGAVQAIADFEGLPLHGASVAARSTAEVRR